MTGRGADPAPPPEPRRPRRADARRNYEKLLAAAKATFDEHGVDAPLDDIARRAGVGNATMYRHFPTRRELIVAVYADEVAALCARGTALLDDASPGDALFRWIGAFIAHVAAKRALALAVPDDRDGQRSELFAKWHGAMRSTADALLTRARQSGAVRAGLSLADLLALAHGIALTATDTEQRDRLLLMVRHGTDPRPPTGETDLGPAAAHSSPASL